MAMRMAAATAASNALFQRTCGTERRLEPRPAGAAAELRQPAPVSGLVIQDGQAGLRVHEFPAVGDVPEPDQMAELVLGDSPDERAFTVRGGGGQLRTVQHDRARHVAVDLRRA